MVPPLKKIFGRRRKIGAFWRHFSFKFHVHTFSTMYLIFSVKGDNYLDIFVCLREIIYFIFQLSFQHLFTKYNLVWILVTTC